MPSPLKPSRLVNYSTAAAAAGCAGCAGVTLADVTSGTFGFSFGRTGGSEFFNGFSISSATFGYEYGAAMGDLSAGLFAFQDPLADVMMGMRIRDANGSNRAIFNQSEITLSNAIYSTVVEGGAMVDAGVAWQAGTSTVTSLRVDVFSNYFTHGEETATWTNPDATGAKFVNFFIDGDDGDIYGWIQIDWNITDANDWSLTISNWAYSDDGPLAAGSTGAPVVPGLGGLAALAIGAAGVRGRRQRVAG